jgi:hypothetical protein
MRTVSIIYNGTQAQQVAIAMMLGDGNHVTVWGAPDDYRLPAPITRLNQGNGD